MTKLFFTKMQGCGNDYIYFNAFDQTIDHPEELAVTLSDRHFGVGGDGIVLICPSEIADAKMRMFNLDGSEGKMCGNAVRCVGKYLFERGIVTKEELKIETLSGIKTLGLQVSDGVVQSVRVDMGAPKLSPECLPAQFTDARVVNRPLELAGRSQHVTLVSMGNPHCVVFKNDLETLDIEGEGRLYETAPCFPEGINTEFVKVIDPCHIEMRVWERGSGETLACGTGACASAVACVLRGIALRDSNIHVKLLGGELIIRVTDDTVYMTGPAEFVFEGSVEL